MEYREVRFANFMGKIGFICSIASLLFIAAFAASEILVHINAVSKYAPGVAAALGTVSSIATYYGYVRILRRKKKTTAKDEAKDYGKSEMQSQVEEMLQALPSTLSTGCATSVSTVALGASLAASTIAYVPQVHEMVFPKKTPPIEQIINEQPNDIFEQPIIDTIPELPIDIISEQTFVEPPSNGTVKPFNDAFDLEMPGENGKYVIQVSLYTTQQQAEITLNKLAKNGITEAYAVKVQDPAEYTGIKYRVRIGNFTTISTANNYINRILSPIGYSGAWVDFKRNDAVGKPAGYKSPLRQDNVILVTKQEQPKPEPVVAMQLTAPQPQIQPQVQEEDDEEEQPQPQVQQPQQQREAPQQRQKQSKSSFFVGVGSELNSNTPQGTAIGLNVELGYEINKNFALGASTVYSNDMHAARTIEPTAVVRYYLIHGLFTQAQAGGVLTQEDGKSNRQLLYGTAAGWKLGIENDWFVEPAMRVGYPMVWGTGVKVGKNF